MSAAHEAVDVVQYLLHTGAATDLARAMGEAFAHGLAAERDRRDKEGAASNLLADALLPFADREPEESDPCHDGICSMSECVQCRRILAARAALRAAGRTP